MEPVPMLFGNRAASAPLSDSDVVTVAAKSATPAQVHQSLLQATPSKKSRKRQNSSGDAVEEEKQSESADRKS